MLNYQRVTGLIQPEQQGMRCSAWLQLKSHGRMAGGDFANADLGTKKDYSRSPVWDH